MPATEASLRHHTGNHHRNKHYKEFPWWGGEGTQSREASWGSGGRCGWWAAGTGWAGPFLTCPVIARQRHKALGASWDLIWAQIKLDGSRVVSDSYKKWVSRTENTIVRRIKKKKKICRPWRNNLKISIKEGSTSLLTEKKKHHLLKWHFGDTCFFKLLFLNWMQKNNGKTKFCWFSQLNEKKKKNPRASHSCKQSPMPSVLNCSKIPTPRLELRMMYEAI